MENDSQPQYTAVSQLKDFNFVDTTATRKIFTLKKRIRAVSGGTSSSKTISILFWCIDYCQVKQSKVKRVSVVSESYPHLENGAMLDFENIMKDRGYWEDARWNKTKHIYTFPSGNQLQFFSPDTYGKAHGPRRDVLYVNEANNLDYKIVDQLVTRTREIVWFDWNPTTEFWFYTEYLPYRSDIEFLGDVGKYATNATVFPPLTYKDNEALDKVTVEEIESHKHNKNWWTVYGEGKMGDVEGRIYTGWNIIDEVPRHARLRRRVLDYGFSNDPSAILDMYEHDGGYVFDEQLYQKGMLNSQLSDFIANLPEPQTLVIADSAEPKSIAEMKMYGTNIVGVEKKNKGQPKSNTNSDTFIKWSIGLVQDKPISITKNSLNTIDEYRKYMWLTDKDGKVLNEEDPKCANHSMAAIRYGVVSMYKPPMKMPTATAPALPYYPELGV